MIGFSISAMKVLYLITKSNWGGAQRHVFDLATEAKKQGFDVAVALGGNGILKDRLDAAGVRTISIASLTRDISVGSDAASFKNIWNIIRREKPDVLHLHSSKAAGMGSLAGRLLRVKKIIFTAHGWAWNEDRPFIQKGAIIFFSWLTAFFCTETITLSEKETAQARMLPFVRHKIQHISLGITPPIFYGRVNALDVIEKHLEGYLPKKYPVEYAHIQSKSLALQKRPVVGTIAELHRNKGQTYLIRAFREIKNKIPNVALVMIGSGELEAELFALIKEYDLLNTVYLAGYVDQASQYLKGFTLFTLPSLKEGLPYTIFEAAYAGVPVIATNVGGIPEMIEDMKSGVLVQPKKATEIAHAITFMLEHHDTDRAYASALRQRVDAVFPVKKMYTDTFALYNKHR